MTFAAGSLVKTRGREWVVLPGSDDQMLIVRPLGGTDAEIAGVLTALERVEPASFDPPTADPSSLGDFRSCRLLRDAARLGFRSSAGPFRSFGKIAFEPRPYQFVPLLMALKLDTVRMLIADDVGVGKTIEAGLIIRELLDRGEIDRFAVLCPPHLAEQWRDELRDKFHLEAELVLHGTIARLERDCSVGASLFEKYPYVVVSTDLIKSERRRDDFVRSAPELVIVDEAHTCAHPGEASSKKHQRHHMLTELAADPSRGIVLVTATPHGGHTESFRSLVKLLDPALESTPIDPSADETKAYRELLARRLVQRRRGDIKSYLDSETPFPARKDREIAYKLSKPYKQLFDRVLDYARESVQDVGESRFHLRIRWWSALALLRALASSPAAAAATLRARSAAADAQTEDEADSIGRRAVLDLDDESAETLDVTPGADPDIEKTEYSNTRRRLLDMAKKADELKGEHDEKLKTAAKLIDELLSEGFRPIVFCRFIATAEYLKDELHKRLPKGTVVVAVTGALPPEEREERVAQLSADPKRVLVCTDCLSEGINLQEHFDAVFHYDLSWNPTRHEQREGRVDRFGQRKKEVRALTFYGVDNQIDGVVLNVLIQKHKKIRDELGISVPVPIDTRAVIDAILEGLLLNNRSGSGERQDFLPFNESFERERERLHNEWQAATDREKQSRSIFAQQSIKPDEVFKELTSVRSAIGSVADVERFTIDALRLAGAVVAQRQGAYHVDLAETPRAVRDAIDRSDNDQTKFMITFDDKIDSAAAIRLGRSHPIVEGLAAHILDSALDPLAQASARRAGVVRTARVDRRTTILILRLRYHLISEYPGKPVREILAEDCLSVAFERAPENAVWIDHAIADTLLDAQPDGNIEPDQARDYIQTFLDGFSLIQPKLEAIARERGDALLDAHRRVRIAAKIKNVSQRVVHAPPVDILAVHILLPIPKSV